MKSKLQKILQRYKLNLGLRNDLINIPLSLYSISLWLAATALVLLLTSEMITLLPEYSRRTLINKKFLRVLGIGCGFAFVVVVIIQVFNK
jgi:hypothetical protein